MTHELWFQYTFFGEVFPEAVKIEGGTFNLAGKASESGQQAEKRRNIFLSTPFFLLWYLL